MTKELKSKKTGRISIISDEDYAMMVNKGTVDMRRFTVTDLRMRPIIPSLKHEVPLEVKKIKPKKDDG
jgi:hypothetical protein